MLSVMYAECHKLALYAILLGVVMLGDVMLNVVVPLLLISKTFYTCKLQL
jgi:hypothetical protein